MRNFDALPLVYEQFKGGPCKKSLSGEHQYGPSRLFETTIERGGNTYRFKGFECEFCKHIAIPDEVKMIQTADGSSS